MVRFRISGVAGVMAELRNVQEKYRGRGASSRGLLCKESFLFCFFVGDATQVEEERQK